MAAADYRLCDVCDSKTFYDSDLNYDWDAPSSDKTVPSIRYAGKPDSGLWLDRLGDWAVICRECAKTHKTIVVPITHPAPDGEVGGS